MGNKIFYIASAGSGKTTQLINHILEAATSRIAFITFTSESQKNTKNIIIEKIGYLPRRIRIFGWYEFMMRYFILPYKSTVISELKTKKIGFTYDADYTPTYKTKSGQIFNKKYKDDLLKKFFTKDLKLHKDLTAEFAYLCIKSNQTSVKSRVEECFEILCFDEAQDFSGYDMDIFKILVKNVSCEILFAGDSRQHIYSTTKFGSKKYNGRLDKYIANEVNSKRKEWVKLDYTTLAATHRSVPEICDLASLIFPNLPKSVSCSCEECNAKRNKYQMLKGVFMVREKDLNDFSEKFKPLHLIFSAAENLPTFGKTLTMGKSKGDEADSVLIYPTEDMSNFVFFNREVLLNDETRCKLYVAVTRARYLVGIVLKEKHCNKKNNYWSSKLRDWLHPEINLNTSLFDDEFFE